MPSDQTQLCPNAACLPLLERPVWIPVAESAACLLSALVVWKQDERCGFYATARKRQQWFPDSCKAENLQCWKNLICQLSVWAAPGLPAHAGVGDV